MNSERIKTELSCYHFESGFASWLDQWLEENFHIFNKIVKARLCSVSIGLSFEPTQDLVAITLTVKGSASEPSLVDPQINHFSLTLIFSESHKCFIESIVDRKATTEKKLPYGLKYNPSRINPSLLDHEYGPAFMNHCKVHFMSGKTPLGYHWVMLEKLGSETYEVEEYCGFELTDSHYYGQSRQKAVDVFLNESGNAGYFPCTG